MDIILVAHDIRSTHNVGSLLRTAECLGVSTVFLTGYTPYPATANDTRLPHIYTKLSAQIHKTALGAETLIRWQHEPDVTDLLARLRTQGYVIVGLEQNSRSIPLPDFIPPAKCVLLIGREVEGIALQLLEQCDQLVEIPQQGKKESLNVVQATAIALYHFAVVHR